MGEELFAELLERAGHEADGGQRVHVRLAFFQYLKPETRIRLMERRRTFLEGRGSDLKRSLQAYREQVDGYTLSLMDHQLAATETDIRWLNDLIEAEQRQVRRARSGRTTRPSRTSSRARTARLPKQPQESPAPPGAMPQEKEHA